MICFAQGQYDPQYFPNENESMAKHYLYEKLLKYSDLLAVDASLQTFFNTYYNTVIRGQTTLQLSMEDFSAIYQQFESLLHQADSSLEVANDSLSHLLELNPNQLILDAIHSIQLQIQNLHVAKENLQAQMLALKNNQLEDLILENSIQLPVELPEINEQLINDIYLSTIAQGIYTFAPDQISILDNIRNQCPYAGGNAVYRARVLYEYISADEEYEDETACIAMGIYRNGQFVLSEDITNDLIISIIPNPSTSETTVHFNRSSVIGDKIFISDDLSRVTKEIVLSEHSLSVKINTLPFKPGVYLVRFISLNGYSVSKKLIIIK